MAKENMTYEQWDAIIDDITAPVGGTTAVKKMAEWRRACNYAVKVDCEFRKVGMTIRDWRPLLLDAADPNPELTVIEATVYIECLHKQHKMKGPFNKLYHDALQFKGAGPFCSGCARVKSKTADVQFRDARLWMSLVHDERGETMDMTTFAATNNPYYYTVPTDDEARKTQRANLLKQYRKYIPLAERPVHIACDDEYAFVWAGPLDAAHVSNPLISNLIENHYDGLYFGEESHAKEFRSTPGIKLAIEELLSEGAKVLNVCHNPSYIAPGDYSWGDITTHDALAEYIKGLEAVWLDWQRMRMLTPTNETLEGVQDAQEI